MKWLPLDGSVQWSADHRYFIVQANSQQWIAYRKNSPATAEDLGVKPTDEEARTVCDDDAIQMDALRKRA